MTSRWYYVEGRGAFCDLEGDQDFPQLGINVQVFEPGEAMAMYHWEADQEDFLVVSGEAAPHRRGRGATAAAVGLRPLSAEARSTRSSARGPGCIVVAVGAREHQDGPDWGGYTVDEVALRHEAGVEQETTVPDEAYAAVRAKHGMREQTAYREGWLP